MYFFAYVLMCIGPYCEPKLNPVQTPDKTVCSMVIEKTINDNRNVIEETTLVRNGEILAGCFESDASQAKEKFFEILKSKVRERWKQQEDGNQNNKPYEKS